MANIEGRFDFGSNWKNFLQIMNDERIREAENSLTSLINKSEFLGRSFLDAGCGSGLFSLAAKRLGASVTSFDFDPGCVACAKELRKKNGSSDVDWAISQGSILDESFLARFAEMDIVYSWGVLHHTGDMKRGVELLARKVKPGGIFFISLYNDQGVASRCWRAIKRTYTNLPKLLRPILVFFIASIFEFKRALGRILKGRSLAPIRRGMSIWHDWVDWCGGYPFEVAKPDEIIELMQSKGFFLENSKFQKNGWGCNEFVFRKGSI